MKTHKRVKQRALALLALVCVLFAAVLADSFSSHAATIHTIPGSATLSTIKTTGALDLSKNTLAGYTYHSTSGKRVSYTDSSGKASYQFTVPMTDNDKTYTFTNCLTLTFSGIGTINGRKLNATVDVTKAVVYPASSNFSEANRAITGGQVGIFTLGPGYFSVGGSTADTPHGYRAKKLISLKITVRYADGNKEVVPLSFYQAVLDIDAGGYDAHDYYRESWTGNSGYSGDLYVFSGRTTSISGMTIQSPGSESKLTDGDDIYLKTGAFATTTGGTFSMTFQEGNCATRLALYSSYVNLISPSKSVSQAPDGVSFQKGDTVTWTISQKMPTYYGNAFTTFSAMAFEDVLPSGVTYASAKLLDGSSDVTGSYGTLRYDAATRKVSYTMSASFLKNTGYYNARTLRLQITATVEAPSALSATVSNTGTVTVDGLRRSTNTVSIPVTRPVLQLTKSSGAEHYNCEDKLTYTLILRQTTPNCIAHDVVLTDQELEEGVVYDPDSVKLSGVSGTVDTGADGFVAKIPKLKYGETATVTLSARIDAGTFASETADNTATAQARNASDVQASAAPKIFYRVETKIDHGTITGARDNLVNGSDFSVEYTPEDGYYVAKVIVDGEEQPVKEYPDSWTFTGLTGNHSVEVRCRKIPQLKITKVSDEETYNYKEQMYYIITLTQTIEGAVADDVVLKDQDMTPGLVLDTGSLTVTPEDAEVIPGENSFEIRVPELAYGDVITVLVSGRVDNERLEAVELKNTATASCSNGASVKDEAPVSIYYAIDTSAYHGTITPTDAKIPRGEDRTVRYQADDGYYLKELKVDGNPLDVREHPDSLTFTDIRENYNVEAVFARIPDIKVTKTTKTPVCKSSERITYQVKAEQTVKDAVAEDVILTDKDITEGLTLLPETFSCSDYTAALETGENAFRLRIPELHYGEPVLLTIQASIQPEQLKDEKTENHVSMTCGNNEAAYSEDRADCLIQNEIRTSAVHGTVTPDVKGIPVGEDRTVDYGPDDGYYLSGISIDGQEVADLSEIPESYEFQDVRRDHEIHVAYAPIPELEVTKTSDQETYEYGDIITYTVTVTNKEPDSQAQNLVLTDQFTDFSATLLSDGITCDREADITLVERGLQVTLSEPLGYGETVTLTYQAEIGKDRIPSGGIKNTVSALAEGMEEPETAEHTVSVRQPEFTVLKTMNRDRVPVGTTVTFMVSGQLTRDSGIMDEVVFQDLIDTDAYEIDWETLRVSCSREYRLEQTDDGFQIYVERMEPLDKIAATYRATAKKVTDQAENHVWMQGRQSGEPERASVSVRITPEEPGQTETSDYTETPDHTGASAAASEIIQKVQTGLRNPAGMFLMIAGILFIRLGVYRSRKKEQEEEKRKEEQQEDKNE